MPVILKKEMEREWILGEPSLLNREKLLQAYNDADLKAHTVNPRLSSVQADPGDPKTIEPFEHNIPGSLF
jgi:putative SOS response-associated peptidase YedK